MSTRAPERTEQAPKPRRVRIDPRFRQRRIDVKRQEGRRRLRTLIVLLSGVVVLALAFGAARSPLLGVRHVRVFGATRTAPIAIVEAAGLGAHPNMLDVHSGPQAAAVERLPWVATAKVHRQWPSTVTITVTERTPVALLGAQPPTSPDGGGAVASGGATPAPPADLATSLMQVDARGRILAPADGQTTLPVIILAPGVTVPPMSGPGSQLDAVYAPGIATAAAVTPTLAPRITGITIGADATVTIGLSGGASAIIGGAVDLGEKMQAIETILDHVAIGKGVIDVTVPTAPAVSGAPSTGTGGA